MPRGACLPAHGHRFDQRLDLAERPIIAPSRDSTQRSATLERSLPVYAQYP